MPAAAAKMKLSAWNSLALRISEEASGVLAVIGRLLADAVQQAAVIRPVGPDTDWLAVQRHGTTLYSRG